MKTSVIIALLVTVIAVATTGMIATGQTALAAPGEEPHGNCFENEWAFGCAGNHGGFIDNREREERSHQ